MSYQSTSKSAKGNKSERAQKGDKADTGKGSNDKGQSVIGSGGGDSTNKANEAKIKKIIELTGRPEDRACLALHECDYDVERTIIMLLDLPDADKWETTVKKKKTRQQSAGKTEAKTESAEVGTGGDDWNEGNPPPGPGEKGRNKNNSQKYNRHGTRVWKGRENQENERNNDDGNNGMRDRRGRSGGPGRGGSSGGRGRGGGRTGGRYPPRNKSSSGVGGNFNNNRPMETWDNSWENTATADSKANNAEENWCDEFPGADEWVGTLSETKVFTPSQPASETNERDAESAGGATTESSNAANQQQQQQNMEMLSQITSGQTMSGTLNAAQSQYFNQLTQQSNSCDLNKYPPSTQQQHAAYGSSQQTYNSEPYVQQAPVRTKIQRAKFPPPSKIPASAVEMPGDANSSMGLLDLQFGAMDMTDNSFECSSDSKYSPLLDNNNATIDLNLKNQSPLDSFTSKKNIQGNMNPLSQSQFSNTDAIPQNNEHLSSGGYSSNAAAAAANVAAQRAAGNINSNSQISNASLDQLGKQTETNPYSQTSNFSSYQSKAANFSNHSYSSSNYTGTQTTASYVSSQTSSNYVSNNDASTFTGGQNTTTSYAPYSGNASSYQSNSDAINFPSISSNQPYQSNSGINSFGSNGTSQYNNYNANHKIGKESANAYDTGSSSVTNSGTNNSSSTTTPLTIVSSSTPAKNTTTSKSSTGVVSNIPPTATPAMMGQYIMGQVPYFPPMYSYEDMQIMQQRIPHMTTPFYEMSYQTPATTLRDGNFSLSDGRFTRTDNNASPVSSSQTNTQPILAAQTTGPYFFTPYNPIQPSYQFGAVYSQLPAGTNAHANNNNPQFAKPTTYGTNYNTGYDSLSQSQDYTKGGYISNNQGQSKGSANNSSSSGNSANELSAIYSKSHSALGKVNSYEKQGFHSGTPPPFTGALGQNALAQGNSGYGPQMFIQTMPQHQHHSSPLIHQPLHQMEVRHHGRRMDAGNGAGQRNQGGNQQKSGSKQTYPNSYWNQG